ncbi:hypothetical protein TrVE_jg12326 [Triparma verrucosa]|uniref:Uncharacterized protein n=1 Tax=Triparma verrucosa TaxID=1606542 RepID=A0A9W7C6G1_9STRA|nr:hypothetical protein TrVE_jg12326 [Triparma verrucosa]
MKFGIVLLSLLATSLAPSSSFFVPSPSISSSISSRLFSTPDVLVIGPSILQLVVAKHISQTTDHTPLIVAPQKTLDSYVKLINDKSGQILKDSLIGLPDLISEGGDVKPGTFKGVVFTAEEPVISGPVMKQIMEWEGFEDGFKAIICGPISTFVNKEKKANWMPILNNDRKEDEAWRTFTEAARSVDFGRGEGCFVRHGSLMGGGVDGDESLEELGLDEGVYKMSLEQYRDLRERAFDRYRLGGQVLSGDSLNPKPEDQSSKEKETIKSGEDREAFCATGGYPEIDRTNRHTLASSVCHILKNGVKGDFDVGEGGGRAEKEVTVLSKAVTKIPKEEEWARMFDSPGPAEWPKPEAGVSYSKSEA